MASASITRSQEPDNTALLSLYGMILGFLGSLIIGVFWAMGANLKATGNGGTIVQQQLSGLWNTLFWAYPFVVVGTIVIGIGLFAIKRYKEAAGIAVLPILGVVAYYFALVTFHVGPR